MLNKKKPMYIGVCERMNCEESSKNVCRYSPLIVCSTKCNDRVKNWYV